MIQAHIVKPEIWWVYCYKNPLFFMESNVVSSYKYGKKSFVMNLLPVFPCPLPEYPLGLSWCSYESSYTSQHEVIQSTSQAGQCTCIFCCLHFSIPEPARGNNWTDAVRHTRLTLSIMYTRNIFPSLWKSVQKCYSSTRMLPASNEVWMSLFWVATLWKSLCRHLNF